VVKSPFMERLRSYFTPTVMSGLGFVLLASGTILNIWYAPTHGQDFAAWWFPAAQRFAARQNIYVISGDVMRLSDAVSGVLPPIRIPANAYPPLHAALVAPLVPLGQPLAQYVFLLISLATFMVGLWHLLRVATEWSPAACLLALGVAMWASSLRWSSAQYQLSLAAVGLVCVAMSAEMRNRPIAVVVAMALCVKFTMLIPIVAVLILRRKIRTLIASGILAGALNLACFVWMGFQQSLVGYRLNVANYVVVNGLNYASISTFVARLAGAPAPAVEPPGILLYPGFDYYYYPEHTHCALLMSAFTPTFAIANLVGGALAVAFAVLLAWFGWRQRERWNDREMLLRWFSVWSCFGLVAVTHLKYDLLLLIPVSYVSMGIGRTRQTVADRALAFTSFIAAFCLTVHVTNAWIFGLAVPLKMYWLVPFYVYVATIVFGVSIWALESPTRRLSAAASRV